MGLLSEFSVLGLKTARLPAAASVPMVSSGAPTTKWLASAARTAPKPSFASTAPGTSVLSWLMETLAVPCT